MGYDYSFEDDEWITSDPEFAPGVPIVKGTHVTVEQILWHLAKGMTRKQILEEYPQLTEEGFRAALLFTAESVRFDHVTPRQSRKE